MRIQKKQDTANECIVYLESFARKDDGSYDIIVDFRRREDFYVFQFVLQVGSNNNRGSNIATILELRSVKASKRLIQGRYYKLNLDLLKNHQFNRVEDSYLICGSFDMSSMPLPADESTELLQRHEPLDPKVMSRCCVPKTSFPIIPVSDDLKVFVKNVGQANWNELRKGETVLILFDAGAPLYEKKTSVEAIFNDRKDSLKASKPILVISHWDKDHIHCLKCLNDNDIKDCFGAMICVDKLKTDTAISIFENFKRALGPDNTFCLPLPKGSVSNSMHLWRRLGCISLYQGEDRRNINFCGLAMFVKGNSRSANYTGDCRLSQAKDIYDQEIAGSLNMKEHVLVAPHHGGDYGAPSRVYSAPSDLIAVSVGNNSYGHPNPLMLNYLKTMGEVKRTDKDGDIEKSL